MESTISNIAEAVENHEEAEPLIQDVTYLSTQMNSTTISDSGPRDILD